MKPIYLEEQLRRGFRWRRKVTAALAFACVWVFPDHAQGHGEIADQIAALTRDIAADPANVELYFRRAELNRSEGNWLAAQVNYQKCRELMPENVAIDFYEGRLLSEAGEAEAAVSLLEKYLKARPEDAAALLELARSNSKLGRGETAYKLYAKAVAGMDAPLPEYYIEWSRAVEYAETEDSLHGALSALDSGIKRLGPLVSLEAPAIEIEIRLENYDGALMRIENLLRQSPRKDPWYARKAEVLMQAGRLSQAKEAVDLAMRLFRALPISRQNTKASSELKAQLASLQDQIAIRLRDSNVEIKGESR